jgi:hypothetical protein
MNHTLAKGSERVLLFSRIFIFPNPVGEGLDG